MSLASIMSSGADPVPPVKTQSPFVKQEAMASPAPAILPLHDGRAYEAMPPVTSVQPPKPVPRELPVADEALVETELARIETMEMSDVDGPGFELEKGEYIQNSRKRALELDTAESSKRKVRLHAQLVRYCF
jgi:DNA helicase INO80